VAVERFLHTVEPVLHVDTTDGYVASLETVLAFVTVRHD
jgi:hypothetical protein